MQKRNLTAHDIVQRQKRRRRRERKIKETLAGLAIGTLLAGGLIWAFINDDYTPQYPEHYGQIEYCGQWFSVEDYNTMMAEREAYLESERAEEEAFYQKVLAVQNADYEAPHGTLSERSKDWDADESYLLAKLAMAEMESEDIRCKALVICTVLNRVWSDDFPDTISEVIFEEHDGVYQFSPIGDGRWDAVEPNEDCWEALNIVMIYGWDESQGATYFERTSNNPTWHSRNLQRLFEHCNTTFYKEAGE